MFRSIVVNRAWAVDCCYAPCSSRQPESHLTAIVMHRARRNLRRVGVFAAASSSNLHVSARRACQGGRRRDRRGCEPLRAFGGVAQTGRQAFQPCSRLRIEACHCATDNIWNGCSAHQYYCLISARLLPLQCKA